MSKNMLKFLTIAAVVTMTTTLAIAVLHKRKIGYIRPLKLTYSFIYE